MALRTSKPSGVTPYPTTLIAGAKGSGKTYQLVQASASALVDRSFILTLGEERPDAFTAIPGTDFEMVDHDGTVEGILDQVREVRGVARRDDRPHYFAFDGISAFHHLLLDQAQAAANRRAQAAAQRARSAVTAGNVRLEGQDWDAIRRDWNTLLNLLRTMDGPVGLAARLEERTATLNGVETVEKVWRVDADKNLPYEVTAVVEMSRRGEFTLTKYNDPQAAFAGARPWNDFTMDALWRDMGIGSRDFGVRTVEVARVDPSLSADATGRDWLAESAGITTRAQALRLAAEARGARAPQDVIDAIAALAHTQID